MISSETSYKEREIIMDTWTQLFWLKDMKDKKKVDKEKDKN